MVGKPSNKSLVIESTAYLRLRTTWILENLLKEL